LGKKQERDNREHEEKTKEYWNLAVEKIALYNIPKTPLRPSTCSSQIV
jgi:hypothetical protein